jgi:S-adenosylmethionine-diacylglycerol 3-amino-3-carboxypropyl transferase
MMLSTSLSAWLFGFIHRNHLVYNTCWEDPRLDRQALQLSADDRIVMITSAGCNALDYIIEGVRSIDCVDMNHRQNDLLELKLAAIEALDFPQFFQLFGTGRLANIRTVYPRELRPRLSEGARLYWDQHLHLFEGSSARESFYFRGSSGLFAKVINLYIDHVARVREQINHLLAARTLEEQQEIYTTELKPRFWGRFLQWFLRTDLALAMVGVPAAQRRQLEETFGSGVSSFIEQALDDVFCNQPIWDNYFYRVYLTGEYTSECCPEYLKEDNFLLLKTHARASIRQHTASLLEFLQRTNGTFSRFVLLDHMDWMSQMYKELLVEEWQALVDHATPDARVIWRSGGVRVDYVDDLTIAVEGSKKRLGDILRYHSAVAAELHKHDRVRTYGSFYIANLCGG